jgi:hypothetical protein
LHRSARGKPIAHGVQRTGLIVSTEALAGCAIERRVPPASDAACVLASAIRVNAFTIGQADDIADPQSRWLNAVPSMRTAPCSCVSMVTSIGTLARA